MAIDSAEDRRSAGGVSRRHQPPGVTLNAAQDAEWRVQVAWSYSGISIFNPSTAVAAEILPFVYRRDKRLRASKRTI